MTRPSDSAATDGAFPIALFADRCELVEEFQGGEGNTALLRMRASGVLVVAKVLPAGVVLLEGALLASLRHPAIPAVREVGRLPDGRAFLLREYVAGRPLSELLPMAAEQALDLLRQLLEVLAFVHLRAVLHLDVKPGNVVVDAAGRAHLLDFGLGARRGGPTQGGTPFFAAPELLLGGAPDGRTDLFALGALAVLAVWPGPGKGPPLSRFLQSFPAQPFLQACGVEGADFPAPFDTFLLRCLSRRPERRFGDAQEALEALGGSGRPPVSLLRPDPIALFGPSLEAALRGLGEDEPVLTGGAAADRQAVALHCASTLHDAEGLQVDGASVRVRRRGGSHAACNVPLPTVDAVMLVPYLREVLGLQAEAAQQASAQLLAGGAPFPAAIGERLVALAERGVVVPDGTRWSWPDAQTGRLRSSEVAAAEPATPAAVGAMAAAGRIEQATAAWRRLGPQLDEVAERALRRGLVRGLLAAGEPGRALPLCADLPGERVQALLDLGRLREAEAALPAARAEAPDAAQGRAVQRTEAQLAMLCGEPGRALSLLRALPEPRPPAETITLAAAMAAAGEAAPAAALLEALLGRLPAGATPFLRAAALTEHFLALRASGRAEAGRVDLEEAQALLFGIGHARAAAATARNLGVLAKDRADFPAAVEHLRQARALAVHMQDRAGIALAEANLGITALEAGDPVAAERRLRPAALEFERLGAAEPLRLALVMLARAQAATGDGPRALQTLARIDASGSARLRVEVAKVHELLRAAAAPVPEPHQSTDARDQDEDVSERDAVSRELFRTFLAVNRRLGAESDLEAAMHHLLEAAVTLTGGRRGYLLVQRPDGLRREFESGDPNPGAQAFSRSLSNRAMQLQRTLTGDEALLDRELAEMPSIKNFEQRSAICAPFRSSSGLAGAIYVEHPGRAGVFGARDREHLEVLADQAAIAVDRMLREEQLAAELQASRRDLAVARHMAARNAPVMLGKSPQMATLRQAIDKMGPQDLPVLILGETGTGKELVAQAIHAAGPRRRGPFVAENCSALPAELMERELFGHVQGSFTGADRDRPGLMELAHGGTLLLDEVGDMPPTLQAKLLRALQEKAIRRIGAAESVQIDVRVLAATHKDLRAMVASGSFREDLYYRLAAVELRVPPLREREGDLDLLAQHFLARLNKQQGEARVLSKGALAELRRHPWPGNVRELEHAIARAFVLAEGNTLDSLQLPAAPVGDLGGPSPSVEWPVVTLAEAEKRTIEAALRICGGDKTAAAKTLGTSRTALYDKLKRHGLEG